MKKPENAVEFDNLHTYFFTDTGVVKSVDGVSFEVPVDVYKRQVKDLAP